MILELGVRALLIQPGQAAVASHVGGQDGCKASLYALRSQGDLRSTIGIIPPF